MQYYDNKNNNNNANRINFDRLNLKVTAKNKIIIIIIKMSFIESVKKKLFLITKAL